MTIEEAAELLGSFKVGDRITVTRDGQGRDGEVTRALSGGSLTFLAHQTIWAKFNNGATTLSVIGVAEGHVEVAPKRTWSLEGAPKR